MNRSTRRMFVYVGTFSTGASASEDGIHVYELDTSDGSLRHIQTVVAGAPSFLTMSRSNGTLYAACRGGEWARAGVGAVVAYSVDPESGLLTFVNQAAVPAQPAYIALDRTEGFALVACTFSGAVAVVRVEADGRIDRTTCVVEYDESLMKQGFATDSLPPAGFPSGSPFPHSIQVDPANRFVLVPDVGRNRISVYRFDAGTGDLVPHESPWVDGVVPSHPIVASHWDSPLGAGPRHLCFRPDGDKVYVVNEIESTVSVFAYDADLGTLAMLQDLSTLFPTTTVRNMPADIHLHPSGRYLYASNRGDDTFAVFEVDQASGLLELTMTVPVGGAHPRNFAFVPDTGLLLVANLGSDSVVTFTVDETTGRPAPTGAEVSVPAPSCIAFYSSPSTVAAT